jgi:hypothetical protein
MRGTITYWDGIRRFFAERGFDRAKLDRNCFDGFKIVSADIHEPLEGYAVFRESAPDIFAQFDRLDCSVDRPTDYYRDFFIGECKRPREAQQLVDALYEVAAMDPPEPVYESADVVHTVSLEVLNDIAAMSGSTPAIKGEPFVNTDGELVVELA